MKFVRGDKVIKSVDELGKPMETMKGFVLSCTPIDEMVVDRIQVVWTKEWCGANLVSWVRPEHLVKAE